MQIDTLAALCVDSIKAAREFNIPINEASVYLVTPKGWKPPPKFPRGKLLKIDDKTGDHLWTFNAMRILAWLAANKLIEIKEGSEWAVKTNR